MWLVVIGRLFEFVILHWLVVDVYHSHVLLPSRLRLMIPFIALGMIYLHGIHYLVDQGVCGLLLSRNVTFYYRLSTWSTLVLLLGPILGIFAFFVLFLRMELICHSEFLAARSHPIHVHDLLSRWAIRHWDLDPRLKDILFLDVARLLLIFSLVVVDCRVFMLILLIPFGWFLQPRVIVILPGYSLINSLKPFLTIKEALVLRNAYVVFLMWIIGVNRIGCVWCWQRVKRLNTQWWLKRFAWEL